MKIKFLIFSLLLSTASFAQTTKADSLQNVKITELETKVKAVEELKTKILVWVGAFSLLFGGLTIWNVFSRTKSLIDKKQNEVITNTTEDILKNLSVQLGMPIEQVRRILANADKADSIRSKKILVINNSGVQENNLLESLKIFTEKPKFKKYSSVSIINGFDVVVLYSLDDSLNAKIPEILSEIDGKIQIILAIQQGKLEIDRSSYKSKIQFANDPNRIEPAIERLFS